MNKKLKLLTIGFIIYVVSVSVVFGAYWIYSNIITVTVSEYTLDLSVDNASPVLYDIIRFTGSLTLDAQGVAGETIYLSRSTDNVNWAVITSNTTQADGSYIIDYNVTDPGSFYYRTEYQTP